MAKFWWGSKGADKKKHSGSLGFKDLICFNLAMLAKQGWRLLNGGDGFLRRILKAKYYPRYSFMRATAKPNVSWSWKSILEGRKVLEGGIWWRVGSGSQIRAAEDPWLPRDGGFKPREIADFAKAFRVSQFIEPNGNTWREELVCEAFNQEEAQIVLGIPLSRFAMRDRATWHYTGNGMYTVKSGYEIALELRRNGQLGSRLEGEGSTRERRKEVWKSVWRLPCQGKIKHFVWK